MDIIFLNWISKTLLLLLTIFTSYWFMSFSYILHLIPVSVMQIAYIAFQSHWLSTPLAAIFNKKDNLKIYFHAHKKLPWQFCFLYKLWECFPFVTAIACDENSSIILNGFSQNTAYWFLLLARFSSAELDPWICLQCLANFCQNHSAELAKYFIHLYELSHSIAPE